MEVLCFASLEHWPNHLCTHWSTSSQLDSLCFMILIIWVEEHYPNSSEASLLPFHPLNNYCHPRGSFHPNNSSNGSICLGVLKELWCSIQRCSSRFCCSLLANPNPRGGHASGASLWLRTEH